METISDLLEAIKLGITERITSPLIGTYWISWLIWNFKFVLIIFSGENVDKKLSLMHDTMFSDLIQWGLTFGGPLAMTILFIFVYPYPAQFVYEFRLKFQRRLTQARQKIEDETLLSVEDARALRLKAREQERDFIGRLAAAEQEIDDLRRTNESLKVKSKGSTEPNAPITGGYGDGSKIRQSKKSVRKKAPADESLGGLNVLETAIMKAVSSNAPGFLPEGLIVNEARDTEPGTGNVRFRKKVHDALFSLAKMHGLLIARGGSDDNPYYGLTKEGEKFAEDNNL